MFANPDSNSKRLFLYLAINLAAYVLFLWVRTLQSWLWFGDTIDPYPVAHWLRQMALSISVSWNLDQLRLISYALFACMSATYLFVLWEARSLEKVEESLQKKQYVLWVILPYIAIGLVVLIFYPHISRPTDTADYAMHARVQAIYAQNPYTTPGVNFVDTEPLAQLMEAKTRPSVYGPVWQYVSMLPGLAAGDRPLATIILYKILFFLAGMLSLLLIWHYHHQVNRPSSYLFIGGLSVAWNPVLHLISHGEGHNDILMGLFMLAAILVLSYEKQPLAYVIWGIATLTKFITAPLLAPLVIASLRLSQTRKRVIVDMAVGGILVVLMASLLYLPFGMAGVNVALGRYSELAADEGLSKAALITRSLEYVFHTVGLALPKSWLAVFAALVLPLFWLGYTCIRSLTVGSLNQLVKVSLESILVWLTLVAMPVYAQYAVMPVILLGLLQYGYWHRVAVIGVSLALTWDALLLVYPPSPIPRVEMYLHQLSHMAAIFVLLAYAVVFLFRQATTRSKMYATTF